MAGAPPGQGRPTGDEWQQIYSGSKTRNPRLREDERASVPDIDLLPRDLKGHPLRPVLGILAFLIVALPVALYLRSNPLGGRQWPPRSVLVPSEHEDSHYKNVLTTLHQMRDGVRHTEKPDRPISSFAEVTIWSEERRGYVPAGDPRDPWGCAYLLVGRYLVSRGPDGTLETPDDAWVNIDSGADCRNNLLPDNGYGPRI